MSTSARPAWGLSLLALIASIIFLAIALIIAATSVSGNFDAWLSAGLLAFVVSFLPIP